MKDYVYVRVYWASICWLENCHGVTLTSTYAIIAVGGRSSLLGGGDIPDVSRLGAPPSLVSSRPSSRAKQGLNALGTAHIERSCPFLGVCARLQGLIRRLSAFPSLMIGAISDRGGAYVICARWPPVPASERVRRGQQKKNRGFLISMKLVFTGV